MSSMPSIEPAVLAMDAAGAGVNFVRGATGVMMHPFTSHVTSNRASATANSAAELATVAGLAASRRSLQLTFPVSR